MRLCYVVLEMLYTISYGSSFHNLSPCQGGEIGRFNRRTLRMILLESHSFLSPHVFFPKALIPDHKRREEQVAICPYDLMFEA